MSIKHWICNSIFVLAIAPFVSSAQADSINQENALEEISAIPAVKEAGAIVEICFSNADFKTDLTGGFSTAIDRIRSVDPGAYVDRTTEVCIAPSLVLNSKAELETVLTFFKNNRELTVSIVSFEDPRRAPRGKVSIDADVRDASVHPTGQAITGTVTAGANNVASSIRVTESIQSQEVSAVAQKYQDLPTKKKIILALRGAAAGVGGGFISNGIRPGLEYLTNIEKPGKFVSLPTAALIGAAVDYLQRANGEVDEEKILRNDAAAVFITNLFKFKDQYTYQLGIVMTLTTLPATDRQLQKLSDSMSKKLDLVAPIAMIAIFGYLGSKEKGAGSFKANFYHDVLMAPTYAVYANGLASKYGNPNFGFWAGFSMLLADEANDSRKNSGGKCSWRDMAWGTAGALVGALASDYMPKNVFISFYGKALFASYNKTY